jgi:hypothetical protein
VTLQTMAKNISFSTCGYFHLSLNLQLKQGMHFKPKTTIMKEITLKIPDKEYNFFMKLINSLGFVKVKNASHRIGDKEEIINDIQEAVEEYKLVKQGKLKARDAEDLINEL